MSKQNGASWANEESFEIYGNGVLLETSPTFVNSELRVLEYCLTATTNSQYTLKMKDSYGDCWTAGSWLMAEGLYGNRIFKNFLTANSEEEYTLSLYYGVMKNAVWKMVSGSISGTWTEYNYADSTWTEVTLGSVTTEVSGTQYFRKQFTGLTGMAAYEMSFNYRYGIIAYINGVEILRDNMPTGTVTSTTSADGSYSAIDYHNYIRPGNEVANAQSVLAVEIHFISSITQTNVDFDAYLAIYASSVTEDDSCYIYAYDTTVTSNIGTNPQYVLDYQKSTSYYATTSSFPAILTYELGGAKAYVNGIRMFPYSSYTSAPSAFTLEGAATSTSSSWSTVLSGSDLTFSSSTYQSVFGYFLGNLYGSYRVQFTASSATTSYIYEVQPLICNIVPPSSIEYASSSYTAYKSFEEISISPVLTDFTNCQITPTIPEGLTFDSTTCTLSGIATNSQASSTYTVTALLGSNTYTGTFSLQIIDCSGTFVNILRTYSTNPNYESFTITDKATQSTVLVVSANHGHTASTDWSKILCLTGQQYEVDISSTISYWAATSHLYVNALLGSESDYETILRARYDSYMGLAASYIFNVQYVVPIQQTWEYVMGEVPSNWYSSEVTGWQSASAGSFPASSNQIQLYKKTFSVSSLEGVAGIVISLKYQYGVIIYLNNHEVFRKGFTGDLSTSSYSATSLGDCNFRQISLPVKTIATSTTSSVNYITTGTNTIAIGLVAAGPAQTTASFDCAVRLMGDLTTSRIFDTTVTYSNTSGYPTTLLNQYYGYYIYYSSCADNYYQITFNDDRHEWISSVVVGLYYRQGDQQPREFVLKAKNAEDSEWTTLKTVTGLSWSLIGQQNRIWIENNKAYNMYRFENFATGDSTSATTCYWKLALLDLKSDATTITIPSLAYPTSTTIYKNIEMAEIYPTSTYYTEFTITPSLPTGLSLDPNTGTISGTATTTSSAVTYTVNAKTFIGESASTTFSIGVDICTGGKSLITLVARTDSWPYESSYRLYQGEGLTGTLISSITQFAIASNLNYADFCLPHDIYTLELRDTLSDGWSNPAGYYLTVDIGEMKFEMGQVYTGVSPTSVSTMFSSLLPFQIEYDDWKIYKDSTAVSSNWNTIDFNDNSWSTVKAANIGKSEATTIYIRREVNIPDISKYSILNVRVKYAGGVVAYFNGRNVARFNLDEEFDSETESIAIHDATSFSKFHVILAASGGVTGKNVIAFEIHRPLGQSSAEDIVFDATGVFGVNECSAVLDTIIDVTGTPGTTIGDLENFFDMTPVTYGYQANAIGTYLQWSVENLEGSRFNSFGIQTVYAYTWGFSLYAREEENDMYTSIFSNPAITTIARGRSRFEVPVGIASYKQFKWEVDVASSGTQYVSTYLFEYCKPSGTGVCEGIDDFPPVAEGQISPGKCDYGFRGYTYRECINGQLGEIKTDACIYRLPVGVRYNSQRFVLVQDLNAQIQAPFYRYIVTKFYLAENTFLPDGLTLDETTGAISGIPTTEMALKTYTIYAENPSGAVYTEINIQVRKGECPAEGNFQKATVGEVATYDCALAGSYIGTQKRACLLGERDGEWQKIQGTCIPTMMIVIIVIIIIIIVVVIVFFVVRATKKTKAVGGVKGKKSIKSTKTITPSKKPSAKTIKV